MLHERVEMCSCVCVRVGSAGFMAAVNAVAMFLMTRNGFNKQQLVECSESGRTLLIMDVMQQVRLLVPRRVCACATCGEPSVLCASVTRTATAKCR